MSPVRLWAAIAAVMLLLGILAWRPLDALWCDNQGNIALARGDVPRALDWFERGLALEPEWTLLQEDRGRARLALAPPDAAGALEDFRRAACGAPCSAEAGDAELLLGKPQAAVADYLAARAVGRIAVAAEERAARNRFADAVALEQALIASLGDDPVYRADRASAFSTLGDVYVKMAQHASAIHAFAQASALAPLNEGYLLQYSFAQLQWGDRSAAIAGFRRLLVLHPHQPDAERALLRLGALPPQR